MKINDLKPKAGSTHNTKRKGRGLGSGKGKTCGMGQKGQKARSGVAIKGFEGGQMPLFQRLPKRGFNNIFGKNYSTVSLGRLQDALDKKMIDAKGVIDVDALVNAKVISKKLDGVRVLATGTIKSKIEITVAGASAAAVAAIEKAGGKVNIIEPEVKGPRHKGKDAEAKQAAAKSKKKAAPKKVAKK